MEALSKVHFTVPLYIYVPLILFLSWQALFAGPLSLWVFLGYFAMGWFVWTLTEYLLHRYVFHFRPKAAWAQRLHFIFHGVHHDYPNDEKRLVMPPSASIPLAIGFYLLFSLVLSGGRLNAFFAAFLLGYLFYDISHYALHHFNFKGTYWKKLKKRHMLHHFSDSAKGYGVSSSFWDKVFGSDFEKESVPDKDLNQGKNSRKKGWQVVALALAYLGISFWLIGFKRDQLVLAGLASLLYFLSPLSRKFITGFSIFIVFWVLFDFMKAFPNYWFNKVHIRDLYQTEKMIFGITSGEDILTPNEFLQAHAGVWPDVISGAFYLSWIPVPLLFAVFLFFWNRRQFVYFSLTFLLVNLLGFVVYYLYPAAPPWYVQHFGFDFIAETKGSRAGLAGFDNFFGIALFESIYAKGSNVFAAMPSLHSAYPVIVFYYGIKSRPGLINVLFGVIMAGIWFAAVYTSHHYVLDVLAGILCAVLGILLFNRLMAGKGAISRWVDRFVLSLK